MQVSTTVYLEEFNGGKNFTYPNVDTTKLTLDSLKEFLSDKLSIPKSNIGILLNVGAQEEIKDLKDTQVAVMHHINGNTIKFHIAYNEASQPVGLKVISEEPKCLGQLQKNYTKNVYSCLGLESTHTMSHIKDAKDTTCDNCLRWTTPYLHCETCKTYRCADCCRVYAVEKVFPWTRAQKYYMHKKTVVAPMWVKELLYQSFTTNKVPDVIRNLN